MSPIRLKRFLNIDTFIFCVILALSDELTLSAPKMDHIIKPRDLALIIPKDQAHSVPAFRQGVKFGILPQSYFNKISSSFLDTQVGDAMRLENTIDEWALVSLRVEPCAPLYPNIKNRDSLCWPEIRLVFQPILKTKIKYQGVFQNFFADDRNIHASYLISPYSFLKSEKASLADRYIEKLQTTNSLSSDEFKEFKNLRNYVSTEFLKETLLLRSNHIQHDEYDGFDMRPEYYDAIDAKIFTEKISNFLKRHAFLQRMHTLTAFSLPEGRTPTHTDHWVFKKFHLLSDQSLFEANITISHKNGRVFFEVGKSEASSMQKDDERFYSKALTAKQKQMLSHHVVLDKDLDAKLLAKIANPNQFLVDHTSCASCHKLNPGEPANFHSLSYFLNQAQPTVSPRVVNDVTKNLKWISENLDEI